MPFNRLAFAVIYLAFQLSTQAALTVLIRDNNPDLNGNGSFGDDLVGNLAAGDFFNLNSVVTAGAMSGVLSSANLSVGAQNSLTFATSLSWSSASTLTLDAPLINLNSGSLINGAGPLTLGGSALAYANLSNRITASILNASGSFTVGGSGASLIAGDSFNLFDVGSFGGTFSSVSLPTLNSGLFWDFSSLYSLGDVSVIPEPSACWLLIGAGLFFAVSPRLKKRLHGAGRV